MNKYQEALNEMYAVLNDSRRWHKKKALLQELVDRSTPEKHIAEHCPTCDESVRLLVTEIDEANQTLFYEVSHCWNCGQAIDWSEDGYL